MVKLVAKLPPSTRIEPALAVAMLTVTALPLQMMTSSAAVGDEATEPAAQDVFDHVFAALQLVPARPVRAK
jgi:hypothetical protein